jgi:ABC-type branched-subunit amino acid transport system substrate-binding protein
MREKAIIGIVVTVLLIGAMFTAFPTKAAFVGQIKIGIIGPVGLPHWSPSGMYEGSQMAAEKINAAGGVHLSDGDYEIVLAFGDEHAYPAPDATAAALEAERLITIEGCEYLIGGFRSEVTGALIETAMDYEVPFIINGASTDEFISTNVNKSDPAKYERYKYLFRVNPVNSTMLFKTIAGALQYLIPAKLLPLYGQDLGGPNPQVRVAVVMEDLVWTNTMYYYLTNPNIYPGVLGKYANVTYAGRIPDGTTDCSPWLQGVKDSQARLLIHIFSGVSGVPFIAQWRAMNVVALPVGINVMSQIQTMWATTNGACEYEGMLNFVGTRTPIVPGVTEVFWDEFVARTGGAWPMYPAFGAYNGLLQLKAGLESIGTKDKDALVAKWEDPTYEIDVLNGIGKFDSIHDVYSTEPGPFWTQGYTRAMVVQWLAGRMEVVSPVNMSYSKKWAIPPWMYPLDTDVNYDGKVNIMDISSGAKAFGTKPGDPRWDKESDVNFDGQINILDLSKIAKDFGKSVTLPLP